MECPVTHKGFGEHGGEQYRSPRYYVCGCDAGYCERHAEGSLSLGCLFERGAPKKCKKHKALGGVRKGGD